MDDLEQKYPKISEVVDEEIRKLKDTFTGDTEQNIRKLKDACVANIKERKKRLRERRAGGEDLDWAIAEERTLDATLGTLDQVFKNHHEDIINRIIRPTTLLKKKPEFY